MVAILAALPAILSAIHSARALFDVGKEVVSEITGETVDVSTTQELEDKVMSLPDDQKMQFVDRMKTELSFYEAISHRLEVQGGQVNAQTLSAISSRERAKVAMMRMTTRPWAVRWMVIAVVFPPLAAVAVNMVISVYNIIARAWWPDEMALGLLEPGQILNELYLSMVGWAAGVIMTYMGMREIGKATGRRDDDMILTMGSSLRNLVGQVKAVFN